MILWLFYQLRRCVLFVRRQCCRVAGHKREFTGYYEPAPTGDLWLKVDQCVRCREVFRANPNAPCVRFDTKNPYAR
jgi:hypothetical protein